MSAEHPTHPNASLAPNGHRRRQIRNSSSDACPICAKANIAQTPFPHHASHCATIQALFMFAATKSLVAHATANPNHPTDQMTFGLPFFPGSMPWTPPHNITHAHLQIFASSYNSLDNPSDNFSHEFITLDTIKPTVHCHVELPTPGPPLKP
jgi:hypothetical protein